jgi:hypothetical protein
LETHAVKTIGVKSNSNGSSEFNRTPIMAYPKLGAVKTTKHVLGDSEVAIWGTLFALVLVLSLMLWQHQSVDRQLGRVQALSQKNHDDGLKLTKEVKALEP